MRIVFVGISSDALANRDERWEPKILKLNHISFLLVNRHSTQSRFAFHSALSILLLLLLQYHSPSTSTATRCFLFFSFFCSFHTRIYEIRIRVFLFLLSLHFFTQVALLARTHSHFSRLRVSAVHFSLCVILFFVWALSVFAQFNFYLCLRRCLLSISVILENFALVNWLSMQLCECCCEHKCISEKQYIQKVLLHSDTTRTQTNVHTAHQPLTELCFGS